MVDPRLLTRVFACALAATLSGCIGVHIGRIAGRVVYAETGQGVPGVEIFRTYSTSPVQVMGEVSGHSFTPDWVTSGGDGDFAFPGKWILEWPINEPPSFTWIHRDYGWSHDVRPRLNERKRVEIRAKRTQEQVRSLRDMREPIRGLDYACEGVEGDGAYSHCLLVAYGVGQAR